MCVEKNTPDEIIAVVQAFKNREQIQFAPVGMTKPIWGTLSNPSWNFSIFHYSVKQEPEKVKLLVCKSKNGIHTFVNNDATRTAVKTHEHYYKQYAEVEVDALFKPTSSL